MYLWKWMETMLNATYVTNSKILRVYLVSEPRLYPLTRHHESSGMMSTTVHPPGNGSSLQVVVCISTDPAS
eukprot:scaffold18112_cov168-Amphora_coffeaeformis.AAC.2